MNGILLELFGCLEEFSIIMFCFNRFLGEIGMFGNCSKICLIYFVYNEFRGSFLLFLG